MANLVLLFLCLILGFLLKRSGRLPQNAAQSFNAFVIWVSVPALILLKIPQLFETTELNWELFIPVSMPWLTFALSFCLFMSLGKAFQWSKAQTGALVLTAGLGNTSFVGIPLLTAVLGAQAIPLVLVVDQLGSFLTLSFLGVVYASAYSPQLGNKVNLFKILKSVGTFPPFVALGVTLCLWAFGLKWPPIAEEVLTQLAATLVPLALIAVGFQLKLTPSVLRKHFPVVTLGLSFKLFFAPLIFVGLYVFLMGSKSFMTQVTLLEAAMAPMITAGVVAEEFGFDTEITSLMIGVGIPISLGTVILWNELLLLIGF